MRYQTNPDKDYSNQLPRFHLKIVVFIFTCVLSTFFGGILVSQNLYQIDKKKDIPALLISCGLWQLLSEKILSAFSVSNALLRLFVPNVIGAIILTLPVWNYHFKNIDLYKRRKIRFPLAT
jgi:hypothetical protein